MNRLDKELVIRNLVETRSKAQQLISGGFVIVNGKIVTKDSLSVSDTDEIVIAKNDVLKYVSRGGLKLEKALKVFNIDVNNKTIMDIGSSTGGFTDCLLQNGAKKVVAIDVGTDVMHKSLRSDARVELHENTNIQDVETEKFLDLDLITVDVSFVSLERIVEKVYQQNISVDMICLIKPQFECGKQIATKYGGVVKSKTIHKDVLNKVVAFFNKNNFYLLGLDFSPIKGGDGNIEYIAYFTKKTNANEKLIYENVVNKAFNL